MGNIGVKTVIQRTELPGSRINDEVVFFNQGTGDYYGTGPVGADIWEFLADPKTLGELCDLLLEKYEVDREECEAQVSKFVLDMIDAGICTLQ